ncbi:MAG: TolC family protein [Acinetobacter sp.]|uniref:TolC family protein n=1 Tax=Acinetobacter sp. TaxID=472 RepID=UPI0026DF0346|nr:TolC family protein [Acinetobacter sp.]MDO5544053.1 TolC family protein [Acinetobacter sp.]
MRIKLILLLLFPLSYAQAESTQNMWHSTQNGIRHFFDHRSTANSHIADLKQLSDFQLESTLTQTNSKNITTTTLPEKLALSSKNQSTRIGLIEAIHHALQQRPEISRQIARVAGQSANIDVAKSQYFPQISGGIATADLSSKDRGQQVLQLSATQMLYDFGKVKSSVNIEQNKLLQEQAQVLVSMDDIAFQVADAIVNIQRYQEISHIAEQQLKGIQRIAEIANLRAQAGISSQADPIQAQSNIEAAQSNKIVQETQLRQYQQKLRTLLGYDTRQIIWELPNRVIQDAGLYQEPEFNQIPQMMVAQMAVNIAKAQKQQKQLSRYPTLHLKGNLSQALNGRNPNNNKEDGFDSAIMLEATSQLYQGGAISAQNRAASYAESAAKADMQSIYLEVLEQVRLIREEIENKQRQMQVLSTRRATTIRTRELYQEQYKLGTRTVVDLLNAEQSIHSAAQEIAAARHDIYSALIRHIHVTGRSRDIYQFNHLNIQGFEVQP